MKPSLVSFQKIYFLRGQWITTLSSLQNRRKLAREIVTAQSQKDKRRQCAKELVTSPNRLFFDRSKIINFLKPCNFLGVVPDKQLLERSRKLKVSISLIEAGMLPLRKFLERSKFITLDILWPMFQGIGPEKRLFLKERCATFGHKGF